MVNSILTTLLLSVSIVSASESSCTFTLTPNDSLVTFKDTALRPYLSSLRTSRKSSTPHDIRICLQPGIYDLSKQSLVFTKEDGYDIYPNHRIIWEGSLENPSIISGGTQITSWTETTLGGSSVYVASVPPFATNDIPNVVRQLWVNEYRAPRTIANPTNVFGGVQAWYESSTGATGYTVKTLPSNFVVNGTSMEFGWPIVIHNWIEPRCTISTIVPDGQGGANITLQSNCGILLRNRCQGTCPVPVFMEAVPIFPLNPGTFWYDNNNNLIYYSLASGQTVNDLETNTYISSQEVLISYANTTGHTWNNVVFSYATWLQPNRIDGFVDDQAAVYDVCASSSGVTSIEACQITSVEPVGAVRVATSTFISFISSIFIHIGATYAASIDQGSQDVTVQGCNFTDLSGGFLKLGSVTGPWSTTNNQSMWDARAMVTDNIANNMAVEISGATGLFGGYLYSASIVHNSISDSGYTGLSIGWGWGSSGYPNKGVGNTTVNYNYMHDVMTKLRDGGGIYVNGMQSYPSYMMNNFVDTDEAVFAVFYLDNGASLWNVTNNVAFNSSLAWAGFLQGCCGLPSYNSTIDYLYYKGDLDPVNQCEAEGCVLENAIKVAPNDPWPAEAQTIMNNAGARPAYNHNKERKWTLPIAKRG